MHALRSYEPIAIAHLALEGPINVRVITLGRRVPDLARYDKDGMI